MAVTQIGLIAVWGVAGIVVTAGVTAITGSGKGQIQSADATRSASSAQLDNDIGETVGETYYNEQYDLSISVIPCDSSLANARLNLDALMPAPGTALSIADADSTLIDSSAKYTVQSARVNRSSKGNATIDLTLKRYATLTIA